MLSHSRPLSFSFLESRVTCMPRRMYLWFTSELDVNLTFFIVDVVVQTDCLLRPASRLEGSRTFIRQFNVADLFDVLLARRKLFRRAPSSSEAYHKANFHVLSHLTRSLSQRNSRNVSCTHAKSFRLLFFLKWLSSTINKSTVGAGESRDVPAEFRTTSKSARRRRKSGGGKKSRD